MQDYYVVRQPMPLFGGMGGGMFGPFQGMQFISPGFLPGQGPGFLLGQGQDPPSTPPPSFVPSQEAAQPAVGILAIDPSGIRPCIYRYVYLWLDNGQQFWAWLTFVGRRSVAGWRWTGFNWVYFGVDTNRITSFVCY